MTNQINFLKLVMNSHRVKSIRIRSYSDPHFPALGLNTERHSVSLRIQSECGKMRTRVTPNTENFQAVSLTKMKSTTVLLVKLFQRTLLWNFFFQIMLTLTKIVRKY